MSISCPCFSRNSHHEQRPPTQEASAGFSIQSAASQATNPRRGSDNLSHPTNAFAPAPNLQQVKSTNTTDGDLPSFLQQGFGVWGFRIMSNSPILALQSFHAHKHLKHPDPRKPSTENLHLKPVSRRNCPPFGLRWVGAFSERKEIHRSQEKAKRPKAPIPSSRKPWNSGKKSHIVTPINCLKPKPCALDYPTLKATPC